MANKPNTITGSITNNGIGYVKAKIDGTVFNKILTNGELLAQGKGVCLKSNENVWKAGGSTTNWVCAVNAVDIDWNEAVIPYGNLETGESVTVKTTGELLSLISKMQQEIFVLSAAVAALSIPPQKQ